MLHVYSSESPAISSSFLIHSWYFGLCLESKSITLDNLDELDSVDEKITYQTIKKIDGNYEMVLDSAREIIEKYREEVVA